MRIFCSGITKNIHGEKKNWILTSYDSTNGKGKIKERLSDNTTTITPGANKGSRAVASSENLSTDKVTESSPLSQENRLNNPSQSAIESASAEVETSPTEARRRQVTPRVGQTLSKRERTSGVDALFSRISESAVLADERTRPEVKRRIEEKKKKLLKGWAIATDN